MCPDPFALLGPAAGAPVGNYSFLVVKLRPIRLVARGSIGVRLVSRHYALLTSRIEHRGWLLYLFIDRRIPTTAETASSRCKTAHGSLSRPSLYVTCSRHPFRETAELRERAERAKGTGANGNYALQVLSNMSSPALARYKGLQVEARANPPPNRTGGRETSRSSDPCKIRGAARKNCV